MEDFDFAAQPAAEKPLILHLAQLAWTQEHMNVCFFGPPGTGKRELAEHLRSGRTSRRAQATSGAGQGPRADQGQGVDLRAAGRS